jgi:hypothetical protein
LFSLFPVSGLDANHTILTNVLRGTPFSPAPRNSGGALRQHPALLSQVHFRSGKLISRWLEFVQHQISSHKGNKNLLPIKRQSNIIDWQFEEAEKAKMNILAVAQNSLREASNLFHMEYDARHVGCFWLQA